MSTQRILGLVLLVVGLILLGFGLNATGSVGESVKEGLTGKYTDKTTMYIIGGAAAAVVGVVLTLVGGQRPRLA
jgi:ABC-type dipeptide/oligopeptide/nickel transport system permease subunit